MIKPCSKCLKARQAVKHIGALAVGMGSVHTIYETNAGTIVIRRRDGHVVDATHDLAHLIGKGVYAAGKYLYDTSGEQPVRLEGVRISHTKHH